MTTTDKIAVLADAAKYDASCSTSGSARANDGKSLGNGAVGGICHAWSSDGRCVALLKVLLTNVCAYDCAYCANRRSNDLRRTALEPEELVRLIVDFYRRNYIEGAFLSSGVAGCPDATMERLVAVARTLRTREKFSGYIHLKVIPGSSERLVLEAARWADRVSVNIELPSARSLARIAPDKSPEAIFGPMRLMAKASGFEPRRIESGAATLPYPAAAAEDAAGSPSPGTALVAAGGLAAAAARAGAPPPRPLEPRRMNVRSARATRTRNPLAASLPAGQTTQLVVGASPESDAAILTLAENLYLAYDVRRVYYSAFVPTGSDPRLPAVGKPPLAREHRLYQADWLFRFYGFASSEILDPSRPFLDSDIDPKSGWALRHLEAFPVELLEADYETLLRVPGIGPRSASRIVASRRRGELSLGSLAKLGVVMRRAKWFITLKGRLASSDDPDASLAAAPGGGAARMLERPEFLRRTLLDPLFRTEEPSPQKELPWEAVQ